MVRAHKTGSVLGQMKAEESRPSRTQAQGGARQDKAARQARGQGTKKRRDEEKRRDEDKESRHLRARPRQGGRAGSEGGAIHSGLALVRAWRPFGLEIISPILAHNVVVDEEC